MAEATDSKPVICGFNSHPEYVQYNQKLCNNGVMTEFELYWLAGLLEGEGSFMAGAPSTPNAPRISVAMTDRDIIDRVAALFGMTVTIRQPQKDHHKPSYVTCLRGKKAIDLMTELRPFMGKRRQEQIDRAIASWTPPKRRQHGTRSCYSVGCKRPECYAAYRAYIEDYKARKLARVA